MSKSKSKLTQEQITQLVNATATYQPEELISEMEQNPYGKLAVNICVDVNWKQFEHYFPKPQRPHGMTDEEYDEELAAHARFIATQKRFAGYWYTLGMNHDKSMENVLEWLHEDRPEGK